MNQEQERIIRVLAAQHNSSAGELLWLARMCAANEWLMHLGELSQEQAGDLIFTLQSYGRWKRDFPLSDACELNLS